MPDKNAVFFSEKDCIFVGHLFSFSAVCISLRLQTFLEFVLYNLGNCCVLMTTLLSEKLNCEAAFNFHKAHFYDMISKDCRCCLAVHTDQLTTPKVYTALMSYLYCYTLQLVLILIEHLLKVGRCCIALKGLQLAGR